MRAEPPEFYQAIFADKARKQIHALPDEVCHVIAQAFGWPLKDKDLASNVRNYLHDINVELNTPE